jgi:DNA-binding MarR family transcriptional regulator
VTRTEISLRLRAGLTDKHAAILDSLATCAELTTDEVGDDTGYAQRELSTVLRTLCERGLVRATGTRAAESSRGVRRHACWAITDAGRAAVRAWEDEVRSDLYDRRGGRACRGA